MHVKRHDRTARGWALIGVALALALLGCTADGPPAAGDRVPDRQETSGAPASPRATGARQGVEAAIISRYLAFWDAVAEAADPPDPDHPALGETAADPQLGQLRGILAEDRAQGRFRKVVGTHNPTLRELLDGGAAAVVDDCAEVDPEDGMYDAETGERISEPGEPGYRELLEARLELIGGAWKVVNVNVVEEGSDCEPAA